MLLFLIIHVSVAFLMEDCPSQSQRRLRQSVYCNSSSVYYICLHNTETDKVKEICDNETDYAGPGEKYVWTGGFRNIDCSANRYQPYNLFRNESHECQFIKSNCEGEGQILHRNGSNGDDISCRCDETRNYKYVRESESKVDCIPSKEDCSCYLVPCSTYNNISGVCSQLPVHTRPSLRSGIPQLKNSSSIKDSSISNRQFARNITVSKIFVLVIFGFILIGFLSVIGLIRWFPLWFYESTPQKIFTLDTKPTVNDHWSISTDVTPRETNTSNSSFSEEHQTQKKEVMQVEPISCSTSTETLNEPADNKIKSDAPRHKSLENRTSSSSYEKVELTIEEKELICEVGNSCKIKCHFIVRENLRVNPEWKLRRKNKITVISSEGSKKYQIKKTHLSFITASVVVCSELTITAVKPDDAGQYACLLQCGSNQVTSNEAKLSVEVPDLAPLKIKLQSQEMTCIATSCATIKCTVNIPNCYLSSVQWLVRTESEERDIDTQNNPKYSGGNTEEPSLTINDVTPEDEGEYFCKVRNCIGHRTRSDPVSLHIEGETPCVIALPSKYVAIENDSVTIFCTVVSTSEIIKIQWKRNYDSNIVINISNSNKYIWDEVTCNDNIASLTIKSLKQNDIGKYVCSVTNSAGTVDSKPISLTVIPQMPPPVIIPECHMVNLGLGLRTSISWILISNSQISHISVKRNNGDVELKVMVVSHQTDPSVKFVHVNICQPGTYVCCCRNNYRQSSNSTIDVKLLEDYHSNIDYLTAIDIGSMWSKVAISNVANLATPDIIMSHSEPTCLLLKDNEVLFGEQAKKHFKTNFAEDTFYENFISEISRSEDIMENAKIGGKQELTASEVFILIIDALKINAIRHLQFKEEPINLTRVLWVMTLPSRVFNNGKNLFLKCCSEVGLDKSRILLVSESTAIMSKTDTKEGSGLRRLPEHLTYVIVDFGGYTCKVSAVKKVGFEIDEIAKTSIMSAGGSLIDGKIFDILESIVGDRVIEELKKEYEKFTKLVEDVKHHINEKEDYIKLKLPMEMTNELCVRYKKRTFLECFGVSEYSNSGDDKNIVYEEPFLCIGQTVVNKILDGVSQVIIEQVQRYMKGLNAFKFCGIIFVGGCSNIDHINERLTKAFPELNVERGDGAMETIKGGLRFGCRPNVIISRVTRFAVLRRRQLDFQTGVQWGLSKCCDSDELVPILKKRSYIPVGQDLRIEFSTVFEKQTRICIELFISVNDDAHVLTDEENEQVLFETIQLADVSTEPRYLDTSLEFGYDVISVTVIERSTEIERRYSFPLK